MTITNENDFTAWIASAKPGDTETYYEGCLAIDRQEDGRLDALADAVHQAAARGECAPALPSLARSVPL
jgi:hypothetical protein